ncbi:IS1380 family transposase [Nakamurella sp. PAMC28650]|uniref:IS1380 family transposase n=1 Tax=Nakamurella sp. PAMC28650 TaxID=2762325 RepID=UPI00164D83F3|nr:IS1380 family transposase [Nakamurella sp. PAMC28650]QNK80317.1 IS1380 family transposase [Nakamurella sp. PAMC28650]
MSKRTGFYPPLTVDTTAKRVVSHAGAVLLVTTAGKVGLDRALSAALAPWRKQWAVLDPGKILLDLAISVAIGGDCLADISALRSEPAVFGRVASDPTVSRLIDALAATPQAALAAINQARATVRQRVWKMAGKDAPDFEISRDRPLIIDLDATLITSHSEKELAAPTYKKGFGFHPLGSWVDHGPDGTGEPLSMMLRPGRAGSNTAADHIAVTKDALRQLPFNRRGGRIGRRVLVRADSGGGTHEYLKWLAGQGLSYSVGFGLTQDIVDKINLIPDQGWTPAYDGDGKVRDGAWVTELTGLLDLSTWPAGMRVIVRAERPHPGAQLRFTDSGGNRLTAFVTNTVGGQLADLELRHRHRARCEDRIRNAKDTGLRNLPLTAFAQNQIWVAVVQLATELTAWLQMLALTGTGARRWEPKRLRLQLFSVAGTIARRSRRVWLRLSGHATHRHLFTTALDRLTQLPAPT